MIVSESGRRAFGGDRTLNTTADALVKTGDGDLIGIMVNSASATPTIKIYDNTAASGQVLVNTFTPYSGQFYQLPFHFKKGLYIDVGGTIDYTVSFN